MTDYIKIFSCFEYAILIESSVPFMEMKLLNAANDANDANDAIPS